MPSMLPGSRNSVIFSTYLQLVMNAVATISLLDIIDIIDMGFLI